MKATQKIKNVVRGLKQSLGTSGMKRSLWNKEFAQGRWQFIESTRGDPVYPFIERCCKGGSVLDLGCGYGNTGCELDPANYSQYTGVDISDYALEKAAQRARELNRSDKSQFCQADIATYTPTRKHDVILFRESIYYIPRRRVVGLLRRYSQFLTDEGVFIVRSHDKEVGESMLDLLEADFTVLDQFVPQGAGPLVVVFRPASTSLEGDAPAAKMSIIGTGKP